MAARATAARSAGTHEAAALAANSMLRAAAEPH